MLAGFLFTAIFTASATRCMTDDSCNKCVIWYVERLISMTTKRSWWESWASSPCAVVLWSLVRGWLDWNTAGHNYITEGFKSLCVSRARDWRERLVRFVPLVLVREWLVISNKTTCWIEKEYEECDHILIVLIFLTACQAFTQFRRFKGDQAYLFWYPYA